MMLDKNNAHVTARPTHGWNEGLDAAALTCYALIVALLAMCLASCSTAAAPVQDAGSAAAPSGVTSESPDSADDALASAKPLEEPASTELYALLGITTGDKLIRLAKTSEDDAWIAAHPDAYEVFRPQIQQKCLRLAADEPQAAAFVRGLPDHVVADAEPNYEAPALFAGTPSPEVIETSIPHLYQWDQRWGYTMYDGDAFGLSGCGPTAMAMIYQGLTGTYDRTPYDMGQLAFAGGFVSDSYGGTIYGYCGYAAAQLGLAQSTVKNRLVRIFDKLGVNTRTELASWMMREDQRA